MQNHTIFGSHFGQIKKLSGFNQGHFLPNSCNAASIEFVKRIGSDHIRTIANNILNDIREIFKLKRSDYIINIEDGFASIETPQANFNISITHDNEDTKRFKQRVEINHFKEPKLIRDANFLNCFNAYCDSLLFRSKTILCIEELIDKIENFEILRSILEYPNDASELSLRFNNLNLILLLTEEKLIIKSIISKGLLDLIKNSNYALMHLNKAFTESHFELIP